MMRSFVAFFAVIALTSLAVSHGQRLSGAEVADIQALVPTCDSNVCFAFEGSNMLNAEEFQSQLDFIIDVTSVIGDRAGQLRAAQFSSTTQQVNASDSASEFIANLRNVVQSNSDRVSAGSGLVFCDRSLGRIARDDVEELGFKVVFLGTGNNNLGGAPTRRADNIRNRRGGDVLTVAVGNANNAELSSIAGGIIENIFSVDSDGSTEIEEIVLQICDLKA